MRSFDEEYEKLALAIVARAVEDYESSFRNTMKARNSGGSTDLALHEMKKIEKFFESDWAVALFPSDIDPKAFLEKLKEKCEADFVKEAPDEVEIIRLYTEDLRSMEWIAKKHSIYKSEVRKILISNGIAIRGRNAPTKTMLLTKELLTELYWNQEKTAKEIGISIGVSENTILCKMNYFKIPKRRKGEKRKKLY